MKQAGTHILYKTMKTRRHNSSSPTITPATIPLTPWKGKSYHLLLNSRKLSKKSCNDASLATVINQDNSHEHKNVETQETKAKIGYSMTLPPKLSRIELKQPCELSIEKIHHSLRLHWIQTSIIGAETGSYGLVLRQVIHETATALSRNQLSLIPHPNPTTTRSGDSGSRGGGGIRLAKRRRERNGERSRIRGRSWIHGFGDKFLLLRLILPIRTSVRHGCSLWEDRRWKDKRRLGRWKFRRRSKGAAADRHFSVRNTWTIRIPWTAFVIAKNCVWPLMI